MGVGRRGFDLSGWMLLDMLWEGFLALRCLPHSLRAAPVDSERGVLSTSERDRAEPSSARRTRDPSSAPGPSDASAASTTTTTRRSHNFREGQPKVQHFKAAWLQMGLLMVSPLVFELLELLAIGRITDLSHRSLPAGHL